MWQLACLKNTFLHIWGQLGIRLHLDIIFPEKFEDIHSTLFLASSVAIEKSDTMLILGLLYTSLIFFSLWKLLRSSKYLESSWPCVLVGIDFSSFILLIEVYPLLVFFRKAYGNNTASSKMLPLFWNDNLGEKLLYLFIYYCGEKHIMSNLPS